MYEFLCQFDLMLQNFTDWLSYAAIIVVLVLAVLQFIYFFTTRK